MYRRPLISALLVLTVSLVSLFAAICDLNCRTATMPGMVMDSPALPHSAHENSFTAQHHHHDATIRERATSDADTVDAAGRHQVSDSHNCCDAGRPGLSRICQKSCQNESQEQTAAPRFDTNSALVQSRPLILVVMIEKANHAIASEDVTPVPAFHSLTLRI